MTYKQLHMRRTNMDQLPPLALPAGVALHTHEDGLEAAWEKLIEDVFEMHFSFNDCIVNGGGYKPEYVLYLKKDGEEIATTTAVEKDTFPGEGWLRMVGVSPKSRGLGAGKLIVLAALHSLAARGYKSTVLSTDDARIPAIKLYLSLGFEPIIFDDDHKARWEKVMETIKNARK
ncbi:MAG: GNAT family N-acetyltransferase [Clostridia bacterium]|nr:GNAT family N-acetyltransferase [Clostridia bacterium]